MSTIEIRVDLEDLPGAARHGARLEIVRVTGDRGGRIRRLWVAAGHGQRTSVEVEPGDYLVRVELPSGETMEREASVEPGGVVPVDLALDLGRYSRGPTTRPPDEGLEAMGAGVETVVTALLGRDVGWPRPDWLDRVRGFPEELPEELSTVRGAGQVRLPHGPSGTGTWLHVRRGERAWILAAPSSWGDAEVVVSWPDAADEAPEVTVRDPEFASFAGWLRRGHLANAADIAASWTWLHEKIPNPARAAAGAYVLAATAGLRKSEIALDWMNNLHNWNDDLSDGTIARAALLLATRGSDALPEVRHLLDEVERRGLPLYAWGIRTYVNLLLQVGEHVAGHKERLARARALYARTRPDRVFTTLELEQS